MATTSTHDDAVDGVTKREAPFNPLAVKTVIVTRKINGLTYNVEASTLLSGKTIMIRAEDEFFKEFKETWRISNIIDALIRHKPELGLDKDKEDTGSEAFLLTVAENINFLSEKRDRRKRRMSFSTEATPVVLRPKSAEKRRRSRSNSGGSSSKKGGTLRRFVQHDQVADDVLDVLTFDELNTELGGDAVNFGIVGRKDANGVIVEKDRYVAIGGPGVGGSCNCVAFTVLASQIKKSHMVILHEGRALGKAELEHYPRCAVCKKGPGWHLMNDHKSHISPAIIRDSDRRNSLVRKQSMLGDLLQAHVEELRSPSKEFMDEDGGYSEEVHGAAMGRAGTDTEDTEDSDNPDAEHYKGSLRERTKRQVRRNRRNRARSASLESNPSPVSEYGLGDGEAVLASARIQLLENRNRVLQRKIEEQHANPENVVPIEFVTKLNQAKSEVALLKKEIKEKKESHLKSEKDLREQLVSVQRSANSRELHFGHQLEQLNKRVKDLQATVVEEQKRNGELSNEHTEMLDKLLADNTKAHKDTSEALTQQLQEAIREEKKTRDSLKLQHRLEMEQAKEELEKAKREIRYEHEKQMRILELAEQDIKKAAKEKKEGARKSKRAQSRKKGGGARSPSHGEGRTEDGGGVEDMQKALAVMWNEEKERHARDNAAVMAMQERIRIVDHEQKEFAKKDAQRKKEMRLKAGTHSASTRALSTFGHDSESPRGGGKFGTAARDLYEGSGSPKKRRRPQSAAPNRRRERPQSAVPRKPHGGRSSPELLWTTAGPEEAMKKTGMAKLQKKLQTSNRALSKEINALREFVVQQGDIPHELELALKQTGGQPVYGLPRSFLNSNRATPAPRYKDSPFKNGNGGARSPRGTPYRQKKHSLLNKKTVGYHRFVAVADHYTAPYFKRRDKGSGGHTFLVGGGSCRKKKKARPQTAPSKRKSKHGGYSTSPPWAIDANSVKRPHRAPRARSAPRLRNPLKGSGGPGGGRTRMGKRRTGKGAKGKSKYVVASGGRHEQAANSLAARGYDRRAMEALNMAPKRSTLQEQHRRQERERKMRAMDYEYNPVIGRNNRRTLAPPGGGVNVHTPSSNQGGGASKYSDPKLEQRVEQFQHYLDRTY
jgi:hypothetical protein